MIIIRGIIIIITTSTTTTIIFIVIVVIFSFIIPSSSSHHLRLQRLYHCDMTESHSCKVFGGTVGQATVTLNLQKPASGLFAEVNKSATFEPPIDLRNLTFAFTITSKIAFCTFTYVLLSPPPPARLFPQIATLTLSAPFATWFWKQLPNLAYGK